MIYLSQILGIPVEDSLGKEVGKVEDLGIATGEVFPRITSLAFKGADEKPFMISWRKFVKEFDGERIVLNVEAHDIRFSYLQPEEVLIRRDLLNKQIVDTRAMKVVHVGDLKLSNSGTSQLRLVGAVVDGQADDSGFDKLCNNLFNKDDEEEVIAWNYIDLLDRSLDDVQLMKSHKTLDDLHPADIADIIEQLDGDLRCQVFTQLDPEVAAEVLAELDEEEEAAVIVDSIPDKEATDVLNEMDPDDAADIVSELEYSKAEHLLKLMGIKEQQAVRQLLGYKEETAGRIMTSEFVSVDENATVQDAIDEIRSLDRDFETINYVYIVDDHDHLIGTLSIRALIISKPDIKLIDIAEKDIIYANADEDQEDVALSMSKYNLLAMPIVDENIRMLGIVTADDALDIMEEEHEEDLQIAGASHGLKQENESSILLRLTSHELWIAFWIVGTLIVSSATQGQIDTILAFIACSMLPICLHSASTMIRYVITYYFDNEPDDEDAMSINSFTVQGITSSLVVIGVTYLLFMLINNLLINTTGIAYDLMQYQINPVIIFGGINLGLKASLATCFINYLTAPLYVSVLRKRDEKTQDTSGLALRCSAYTVSLFVFLIMILVIAAI